MKSDLCICCGSEIPEGRQICRKCENMSAADIIKWCADNSKSREHSLILSLLAFSGKSGTIDITDDEARSFLKKESENNEC